MISALSILVILGIVLAAVPVQANYASVTGPLLLGTGESAEFELDVGLGNIGTFAATLRDSNQNDVGFLGEGDGYGNIEGSTNITVKMPNAPGTYTLYVTFSFADNTVRHKDWIISVVQPYVFSAQVLNEGGVDVNDVTVSFLVDGVLAGSKTVNLSAQSSAEVSYSWVTAGLADGQHVSEIRIDGDNEFVTLYSGEKSYISTFYVGQQDYGGTNWFLGIVLAILALVLLWVYRKPVRNRGRPRGRSKR